MDIEEQYDRLLRYCIMKLRDRTLAEDVTQESFLRFFESKSYRDQGKAPAYLYTVAANLCADVYRRRREEPLDELPELPDEADALRRIDGRLSIERALDTLPADERDAVVLRYIAELSVVETARVLGVSRFSVRRRLNAALAKLRKELTGLEE